ncbi:MAG: cyclopropane-fatty-acyl-phospholipid synthase [Woeseiaceae bacterium]|nr:cyclopropane-fatty-acyl-phospholipid synthase [Woeseiaceae bacterium]
MKNTKNNTVLLSKFDELAKRLVFSRLKLLNIGKLIIHENDQKYQFGSIESELAAEIYVHDRKFYSEIAFGGAIGAGEAFILNYWTTSDLTSIIRILLQNRSVLDGFEGGFARITKPLQKLLHWFNRNTFKGSKKNIAAHYDLGNDFFESWLDEKMMYSCAIFDDENQNLDLASTLKLERICQKLSLNKNDHIIEIGTGWGGFAIYAAKNFGCKVTSTTISKKQFLFAKQRVEEAGLSDQITLLLEDYRNLTGSYNKLVSIEMIEAVGHKFYKDYFEKCSSLLKDDGIMLIQAITIADQQYQRTIRSVAFIQKYIFPGGCLPSLTCIADLLTEFTDIRIINIEDIGPHYATTLKHWRDRMYLKLEAIQEMGYSDQFIRMWHYYLCYCEGAFIERAIGDIQVTAIKPQNRSKVYLGG